MGAQEATQALAETLQARTGSAEARLVSTLQGAVFQQAKSAPRSSSPLEGRQRLTNWHLLGLHTSVAVRVSQNRALSHNLSRRVARSKLHPGRGALAPKLTALLPRRGTVPTTLSRL